MLKTTFIILFVLIFTCFSCQKNCETCTKPIGGIAGNSVMETKKVCNQKEINELEASSSGTTF